VLLLLRLIQLNQLCTRSLHLAITRLPLWLHQLLLLLLRLLRLRRFCCLRSAALHLSLLRSVWLIAAGGCICCCCYCVGFRCIGFIVASAAAAAIALASAASAFVVASFAATANGVAST
jgi:hypothetical protein